MNASEIYAARRARFTQAMQRGVALLRTAPEQIRNRDTYHPYRHDSYFYYLCGFPEPEAVLVLVAGAQPKSILFCRNRDPEREIWDGYRFGPERAREVFAVDEAHSISKLDEMMPELLADQPVVHCAVGADPMWDAQIISWINRVRAKVRTGITAPAEIHDVRVVLDEMRLIKDAHEIGIMRAAARISAGAHRRAMRETRPGRHEFEIEAELLHEFRRHGAQAPAYTPIVAGGANACVLHYVENRAELRDGELLLIDAGCELGGYASDITRTFPVGGRFTAAQRDVYELVLAAQAAAIGQVRPGNLWEDPHNAAVRVLAQGFIDLGLCKGTVDAVIESGDFRRYYMHRTGHWLGMDVHDAGDYKREGQWRELAAGMTLTVEPGCYIRAADDVPHHLWNIGVRIEDDALVTPDGCEILTSDAPKAIADIEAQMRG